MFGGWCATFALKAGVWFGRGRLDMVSPDRRPQRACCQAPLRTVQVFGAVSMNDARYLEIVPKSGQKKFEEQVGMGAESAV